MTLDEAIKHAEEVAEKNERRAESVRNRPLSSADFYNEEVFCTECAKEHRQLAWWLKELKRLREQTRWIPVSEKLPEKCKSVLICMKGSYGYFINVSYRLDDNLWEGYGRNANVIAWLPLPEPYKEGVKE